MEPERILIVANPRASGGRVAARLEAHRARIERALPGCRIALTAGPGDASRIVREALAGGAGLVVSVGGDGTHHEVLGGFFDGKRPVAPSAALMVVNGGTGGDFARLVGAPRIDRWRPEEALAAPRRRIDAGHVAHAGHDGVERARVFLNIASFGAGGEVVARVNRSSKRLGGFLTFFLASLRTTYGFRNRPVRVRLDGEDVATDPLFLGVVANGTWFGGGMKIAPDARLDDGLLDVVLLRNPPGVRRLLSGSSVYRGAHMSDPRTFHRRARSIEVEPLEGEPILLDTDGEQPGRLPARFEVLPGALELAPAR